MTKYCLVRVTPCWFHQFLYLYRLLYCVLWKLWIFILTLVFTKISWKQRFTFTIYICAAPKGLISRNILGKREFLVFSHVLTLHIYCTLNFVFQIPISWNELIFIMGYLFSRNILQWEKFLTFPHFAPIIHLTFYVIM